jgi:hypothetical protein
MPTNYIRDLGPAKWASAVILRSSNVQSPNVRFGWWSQWVDATLYLRRKRRSGWAMGRRYLRGFRTVAKEQLWSRWRRAFPLQLSGWPA